MVDGFTKVGGAVNMATQDAETVDSVLFNA